MKKSKLKIEKLILRLSFMGSILFVLSEGIMAWITHSHSLLTDCLFDAADLVMIGPFFGTRSAALYAGNGKTSLWIFAGRVVVSACEIQRIIGTDL